MGEIEAPSAETYRCFKCVDEVDAPVALAFFFCLYANQLLPRSKITFEIGKGRGENEDTNRSSSLTKSFTKQNE